MENNLVYIDLLYFGYYGDKDSGENQSSFIKEITERFPNVNLEDAFDDIKGYRQEVYLDKANEKNYYSWLFAKQWFECSMTMQLCLMSQDDLEEKAKFEKYFSLAKQQYPEEFKKG